VDRTCAVVDIVARSYENRKKLMDMAIYFSKGELEIAYIGG